MDWCSGLVSLYALGLAHVMNLIYSWLLEERIIDEQLSTAGTAEPFFLLRSCLRRRRRAPRRVCTPATPLVILCRSLGSSHLVSEPFPSRNSSSPAGVGV